MISELEIERPNFAGYQIDFLYNPERFTIIIAGTKTGKTYSLIYWLYEYAHGLVNGKQVLKVKPGMNFWWIAPVYSQAKIAFNRLWRVLAQSGMYRCNISELTITTPLGTIIHFKTADKPDNLYGEDVYAAVFDEFTRAKEEAWHALRTTLTATGAKCKFIGNFKGNSNWGHQLSLKASTDPENYKAIKVTAYDAVSAGILSKDEVEQARKDLPPFMFKALYLAEGDIDKARLISDEAINNLVTNSFVEPGEKFLTADLAFQGSDLFVIWIWSGLRVIDFIVIEKSTGKEIEDTIKQVAEKHRVPRSNICYDADGVGLFLEGYLKGSVSFKNKDKPFPEHEQKVEYKHLKAQCQFKLAEMINDNQIFFECDISEYKDSIFEELECYKNRGLDEEGKLETLRKKEIKEELIGGRSPDFTDALMMRMYFELNREIDPYAGI